MARPSKEPPSPSSLVPAIVRYARKRGIEVDALAWRFGFVTTFGERDDVNAAADTANDLLDAIARTEPDVALHLAFDLPSRHHALVSVASRASATVRDALLLLARWTRLLHEGFEASLEEKADEACWIVRTPHRPRGLGRYVQELALAYALCRLREGGGEDLAPTRVWFAHARPPNLRPLLPFFTVSDFEFGRETSGMSFPLESLGRPMRLAEAKTARRGGVDRRSRLGS